MSWKFRSGAFVLTLCLSSSVFAADYPAGNKSYDFDYQGQAGLGLAPESPEDAEACTQSDEQTEAVETISAPAEQITPTQPTPLQQGKSKKLKTVTKQKLNKADVLSASSDLDRRKRRCGALTAAALGTAGYIQRQAVVASGTNAVGLLAATGVVVGGAALAMGGVNSPSNGPAPAPFPVPGAGLLSYLALGMSGLFLWFRRRFNSLRALIYKTTATEPASSSAS
jgi:hypothetical protein